MCEGRGFTSVAACIVYDACYTVSMRITIENKTPFAQRDVRACVNAAYASLIEHQGKEDLPAKIRLIVRTRPRIRRWRYYVRAGLRGDAAEIVIPHAMLKAVSAHRLALMARYALVRSIFPKLSAVSVARIHRDRFPKLSESPLKIPEPKATKKEPCLFHDLEAAQARAGKAAARVKSHTRSLKRAKTDLHKAQLQVQRIERLLVAPVVDTTSMTDEQLATRIKLQRQRA